MKTKNKRDLEKHWAEQAKKAAKKADSPKPADTKQETDRADPKK
jgi:hypothetical protein